MWGGNHQPEGSGGESFHMARFSEGLDVVPSDAAIPVLVSHVKDTGQIPIFPLDEDWTCMLRYLSVFAWLGFLRWSCSNS